MKTGIFLSLAARSIALLIAVIATTQSKASVVFYGGDADGAGRVESYSNLPSAYSIIFDDFKLDDPTTITGLWGNFSEGGGNSFAQNLGATDVLDAYFEIRTGITEGDGGALVKYGDIKLVATATGRIFGSHPEYRLASSALFDDFNLAAGHYWLGIAPKSDVVLSLSATTGTDVATPGDPNPVPTGPTVGNGSSFFYAMHVGDEGPEVTKFAARDDDFSYGIEGVAVPEPSTFIAGALLALPFGLQGLRYLRNRQRAV